MPSDVLTKLLEDLGQTQYQDEQYLGGMIMPRLGKEFDFLISRLPPYYKPRLN